MYTTFGLLLLAATTLTSANYLSAEQPNKFLENTTENVVLNVPFVHQIKDLPEDKKSEIVGSACGPAALTMVFKYLGERTTLYDVISKLPTDVYIKGRMFYNLPEGAKYFGHISTSFKNTPKNIYDQLKEQKPIIMNVQNYNGITGHAIVVVGIKEYNGESATSLVVHDPWTEAYKEYAYINQNTLKQPEGYILTIGSLDPFIIE
jgi:ABC-type bacteriocin/lantibiotic exporter with double-glycine peptidase domain